MSLERFISSHVNPARGGYRPEDVIELLRLAWAAGRAEMQAELQADISRLFGGHAAPEGPAYHGAGYDDFRREGGQHRFNGG